MSEQADLILRVARKMGKDIHEDLSEAVWMKGRCAPFDPLNNPADAWEVLEWLVAKVGFGPAAEDIGNGIKFSELTMAEALLRAVDALEAGE